MHEKEIRGEWARKFNIGNVAIHLHLLPTGKVLFWGRRSEPINNMKFTSLNEHKTRVYLLDTETLEVKRTANDPVNEDELPVNLFCAGHTFQPDGTLLIFGGHVLDGFGEDQTCVYDPFEDKWTAKPSMVAGRWYPTAITLSDGRALVVSGSSSDVVNPVINLVPQVWDSHTDQWGMIQTPLVDIFALYPRLYHVPDGRVFMAGPLARSRFLDMAANDGHGEWSDDKCSPVRNAGQREYAASTMYDTGKIIYVGGGGGDEVAPTNMAELIDLNDEDPQWTPTTDIHHGRRHSFATTLPDGTVLVTGGTKGLGFNDLRPGEPVHEPELWNPHTGKWTTMVPEDDDRCYHHTALLLPDGRVLSSGGGEYAPDNGNVPNAPKDTVVTAQIFSPPYLFKGERPTITHAPKDISYGSILEISMGSKDSIEKVSWARLGSVTHSHNMNQSFQFLNFKQQGSQIKIHAPKNHYMAPPGHYMLFLINSAGVPSIAPIILLKPDFSIPLLPQQPPLASARTTNVDRNVGISLQMRQQKVISEQDKPPVVVGLTPTCPYGLGPCWGGAYEALNNIKDIKTVQPRPNQVESVAYVYLNDDILPDIDVWRRELREIDSGTYTLRGIEITLSGLITENQGQLTLAGNSSRSQLTLKQFQSESKLEWDNVAKVNKPLTQDEASAYSKLYQKVVAQPEGATLQVTGRLQKEGDATYSLHVKKFTEPDVIPC